MGSTKSSISKKLTKLNLVDGISSAKRHRVGQQVCRADFSQELEVLLYTLARDVECVSSGFDFESCAHR